ncbi:MAG: GntR family transcriptional regulator [Hyphomicrobiaceae bacterium]|nr:GntR family transcriptional regulator [Hyphomicrobiaceae bacterium]
MSSKQARPRRAVNKKGRNKHATFVKLEGYVLRCDAYRALRPVARAIYTELRRRFNGRNNGQISCSVRELAAELHGGKDTIRTALDDLIAKGFIKRAQKGSFNFKLRHATTWILTEENLGDETATIEFLRWQAAENLEPGTQPSTSGTHPGTRTNEIAARTPSANPKQVP